MSNYAIIDANGNVVNIADVESGSAWQAPEGFTAIQSDAALIGGTYSSGVFYPPAQSNPSPLPLSARARIALDNSDLVVIRCYSAGVAVPSAWQSYRNAMRAISNGTDTNSTQLPATPSYPPNT